MSHLSKYMENRRRFAQNMPSSTADHSVLSLRKARKDIGMYEYYTNYDMENEKELLEKMIRKMERLRREHSMNNTTKPRRDE